VDASQKLIGDERAIHLAAALAGDAENNAPLRDGATLTIRRITGWDDRGVTITVRGEVQHPGAFGIEPGEKLSSILARAGGVRPGGYSYGAILERAEVRELEEQSRNSLIVRVREEEEALAQLPDVDAHAKMAKAAVIGQWQNTLDALESTPPIGRVIIHVAGDPRKWKDTSDDITVRADDLLIIPKAPNYVMVTGRVYNPAAVAFRPGKSAGWYLSQGGGPTRIADRRSIFVIRADGSVIGGHGGNSWWSGNGMTIPLRPGDTVVVPERVIGGGPNWTSIFQAATLATSVASTALIAAKF
jgi:protein involved in polysaccharide export with SLBB domain